MYTTSINCPFCNMEKNKIVNTILYETKNFYVTPSLGSLTEGYILVVSKKHINSMSELTKEKIDEYNLLIEKFREIFKTIYNKYPIVFEHGSPNINDNKASSVIHAHTHIVNHKYKNEKRILNELNFNKLKDLRTINSSKNYIFYINPKGERFITYNFKPISQFMRIEIAKDLNLLDKFDWRKNIFNNNIILTINKIKEFEREKR